MTGRFPDLLRAGFLGCAAATLLFAQAAAQTIDYAALEQTFGEPVTTSATGSPQRVTDAPVDMIIITSDDIRRSGAHDLPGILRHAAGVDVLQWTNDQADVGVRGYDQVYTPRLLVLVDGRQVYADYFGFTPWSALPVELSAIRQIEIVKGPNTALFGFNALGGVINIVTRNPLYDDTNTASLTGGTQSLAEGTGVVTVRDGDTAALRASMGGRFDRDFGTPVPTDAGATPRRVDYRGEADLDGIVRLSDKIQIGLEASHSAEGQNEISPDLTFEYSTIDTDSIKAQLSADTIAGLVRLTAYTNWIDQRADAVVAGNPSVLVFNDRVTVVQLEDSLAVDPDNTVRLAGEYRFNTMGTTPEHDGTIFYSVYSGSTTWQWAITPSLALTNAVRVDDLSLGRSGLSPQFYPFTDADWNKNLTKFSYNSGLVWHADEQNAFRLIASRGVQLPSLNGLGALLSVSSTGVSVTGTPDVKPTTIANYEVGWDRNLDDLDARLRTSVFHQITDDAASIEGGALFTPGGLWATPANIGNSRADGFEILLNGTFGEGWRWGSSYRFEIALCAKWCRLCGLRPHDSAPPRQAQSGLVGRALGPGRLHQLSIPDVRADTGARTRGNRRGKHSGLHVG